jgi:5-dehydro-2-deoxygluconokinase
MPTKIELEAFLATDDHPFRLRENASFEHLHWATTRRGEYDELTVLAIDHRAQFDDLMNEVNCAEERVAEFKGLAFEALDSVARGDPRFGIIVDERFGSDVLVKAADRPYWVARPIETPKSRPLEFDGGSDLGSVLNRWPATQVVKCLSFYDAGDPPDLREQQETQLLRLFRACRETGHELLLEILAPAETSVDEHSTARALGRLYDIGIMPDWWKLEPTASAAAWQNIVEVIRKRDPHCRGVVLLGLSSPIPDLVASFEAAAPFRLIRGFAVGRTIFHDAARDWLSGAIDDDEAVQVMASRLSALSAAWRTARARVEAVA